MAKGGGGAKSAKMKTIGGKLVSVKSKTGDPACSAAASALALAKKLGGLPKNIAEVLAHCRAKARQNTKAAHQQASGKLADGRGTWQRSDKARQILNERKGKAATRAAAAKPAEKAAPSFGLKQESAKGVKRTTFADAGPGKTGVMFDMKKGDLPGQTSLLERVGSTSTKAAARPDSTRRLKRILDKIKARLPAAHVAESAAKFDAFEAKAKAAAGIRRPGTTPAAIEALEARHTRAAARADRLIGHQRALVDRGVKQIAQTKAIEKKLAAEDRKRDRDDIALGEREAAARKGPVRSATQRDTAERGKAIDRLIGKAKGRMAQLHHAKGELYKAQAGATNHPAFKALPPEHQEMLRGKIREVHAEARAQHDRLEQHVDKLDRARRALAPKPAPAPKPAAPAPAPAPARPAAPAAAPAAAGGKPPKGTHAAVKKGFASIFGADGPDDRGLTIQQIAKRSGIPEEHAAAWTHAAAKKGIVEYDHFNEHDAAHAKQFATVHTDPSNGRPIAAVRIMRPKRLEEMAGEESPSASPGGPTQAERRSMGRALPPVSGGSPVAILERARGIDQQRAKRATRMGRLRRESAAAKVDPSSHTNHPAGHVGEIKADLLHVDPSRFQYKIHQTDTSTGSVGSLAGVKRYDPELGGVLQVWRDPGDGKTYVVNGHNRLDLARRLGAEKVATRFIDAKDATEARAKGALTNIAEGRGDSTDAAKFFRDTGISKADLDARGVPLREKVASEGLALSGLNDRLFRKVAITGDLTPERGAIIGGAGLSHEHQDALHDLIEQHRGQVTNGTLKELTDTVKSSSTAAKAGGGSLFGDDAESVSLALHKARVQDQIKRRLGSEKKLFGTVAKSRAAAELGRAGNVIDTEASGKMSHEAGQTLHLFDRMKNLKGPVSHSLNRAAERIHAGESEKKVIDEHYKDILHRFPEMLNGSMPGSG